MGALEKVMELKRQGFQDADIAEALRQEGVSNKEIMDALSQAKIKQAVYQEEGNMQINPEFEIKPLQENYNETRQAQSEYDSSQQFSGNQQQIQTNTGEYQENPYATQYSQSGYQTNTMIEIAEQVFNEKISHIQRKIEELNEIKSIVTIKMENISERLKRLENVIDKLQISVIEEVSNYGKNISNLKKEVEMVEDSFSKIVNQVAEKSEHKVHHHTTKTKKHSKK